MVPQQWFNIYKMSFRLYFEKIKANFSLFVVYLATLSVSKTTQSRIIGSSVSREIEKFGNKRSWCNLRQATALSLTQSKFIHIKLDYYGSKLPKFNKGVQKCDAFLTSSMRSTCPNHLIPLDLTTTIISLTSYFSLLGSFP